jgi:hypothetical protein
MKMVKIIEQPIVRETLAAITEILGPELNSLSVERAVIGLFFTGVKLSNGIAGACATPIKTIPEAVCCPSSAMAMPLPGKLRGRPYRGARCRRAANHRHDLAQRHTRGFAGFG